MSQLRETTRSRAAGGGTRRRCWTGIAVGAALLVTTISVAAEPGRSAGPQVAPRPNPALKTAQQISLQSQQQNGTTARPSIKQSSASQVRSADWQEAIDSTGDNRMRQVVPVAGERAPPAKLSVPAAEPLSRLSLSQSQSQFDPGQTLQDWAEGAGLIVAFGVVGLWLLRQWVSRRDLPGGSAAHLRTIESLALPQRCRIHLVEVDGRQVLVAADAAGIKSVTVLPDRFNSLLDSTDEHTDQTGVPLGELPESQRSATWHGLPESRPT